MVESNNRNQNIFRNIDIFQTENRMMIHKFRDLNNHYSNRLDWLNNDLFSINKSSGNRFRFNKVNIFRIRSFVIIGFDGIVVNHCSIFRFVASPPNLIVCFSLIRLVNRWCTALLYLNLYGIPILEKDAILASFSMSMPSFFYIIYLIYWWFLG